MRFFLPLTALLLLGGTFAADAQPPKPAKAQPAHERVLRLEGGRNFRDLGGYRTRDGRTVRWGMIYRSGAMPGLTDADYSSLDRLGIRSVTDLRNADERKSEPTLWKDKTAYWTTDLGAGGDLRTIFATLGERTPEKMRGAMIDMYRSLPVAQKAAYTHIFQELVAGRVPLAFNCTAGKDRAGVAAALILSALGVPRATVVQDYLLTNDVLDPKALGALSRMAPELAAPLGRADKAYIDAMFETIDQRYGSVEAYLRKELGVGPAELRKMRARLLS